MDETNGPQFLRNSNWNICRSFEPLNSKIFFNFILGSPSLLVSTPEGQLRPNISIPILCLCEYHELHLIKRRITVQLVSTITFYFSVACLLRILQLTANMDQHFAKLHVLFEESIEFNDKYRGRSWLRLFFWLCVAATVFAS